MGIVSSISSTWDSLASLGKVLLLSSRPFKACRRPESDEIVILGNGPSLREAIDSRMPALMCRSRLAVNFAANAPEYQSLAPQYYVLADGHFFTGEAKDPNVSRLWQNLLHTGWDITLFVPAKWRKKVEKRLAGNARLSVKTFNLTPAEGLRSISHLLYSSGAAMPRPRNVLIPSIMIAIRLGFKKIWLCGADHSWSRTLDVDDENRVISVQPHFYKDSKSEQKRVNTEYEGYHLHDILRSLYIAFRAYHQIADFADSKNVEIINATPGSMIDAFPRKEIL